MEYIASISHGKDSIAMLHIIKDVLHLPLDRIITVDVWFDENTRAELPPMVKFKEKADAIIYDRWGIEVEHQKSNRTYQGIFYRQYKNKQSIYGFPIVKGNWCNSELKMQPLGVINGNNITQYIGIAYDEPKRIEKHKDKPNISMPLVEAQWTEQMCYEWCEQNDLLAPTYTTSMRDGCWFCHNQGVNQLRNLYHNYPELWGKLLALDKDSPVTFHADGHTVYDFDRRFRWEDAGYKPCGSQFRWSDLDDAQMNILQFIS